MSDIDLRGSRVALVADELINGDVADFDVLGVLERAGWGVMLLPPTWYPDTAARPLLNAIGDQLHEYTRHDYAIALVGERTGLEAALGRVGVALPAALPTATAAELTAALGTAATGLTPRDAAATQRGTSAGT
jgi:hypothetical protein